MNAPMNLEDVLREQARRAALTPLSTESVARRARRIRRRRTAGAMVGVAAAVAVVVGGSAVVLDGGRQGATPPIAHSPGVSASVSASASASVSPGPAVTVRVTPSSAEDTTGSDPDVAIWQDGTILSPDGTSVAVAGPVAAFAKDPESGDWLVLRTQGTATTLSDIDPEGAVQWTRPSVASGLAASPDGRRVAYLTSGTGAIGSTGSWGLTVSFSYPGAAAASVVLDMASVATDAAVAGFLPDGRVVVGADAGGVELIDPTTRVVSRLTGGYTRAAAVSSTGLIAVLDAHSVTSDGHGCWEIVTVAGSVTQKNLCGPDQIGFSPDGKTLVTLTDGLRFVRTPPTGTSQLWLGPVDGDGGTSFAVQNDGFFGHGWSWSGNSLVAPVFGPDRAAGELRGSAAAPSTAGTWSVAWLGSDGARTVRGSGRTGQESKAPYVLQLVGSSAQTATP